MSRTADLIKYLPTVLQQVRELIAITDAENPEFQDVFSTSETVLNNLFIESADENGIARFEAILGITPDPGEPLASRVFRVMTVWSDRKPYTWRSLQEKLDNLLGAGNYSMTLSHLVYTLNLVTHIVIQNGFDDLYDMLEKVVPANLVIQISNELFGVGVGEFFTGGGISFGRIYDLT